jgi:hypothetical protein
VGFVTREFVQLETLERAKRWLIEVGFHPSRIELHTHGTLRITVTVEPGQAQEVERILDAVAASDPHGSPSFWDHPHHHGDPKQGAQAPSEQGALRSESFDISWHPIDPNRDVSQISTEIEKQKEYRERHHE